MTDWQLQNEIAELSIQELRPRSVGIVIGKREPQQLGTGTVVRLGARTFLATVAHNFKNIASSHFEAAEVEMMAGQSSLNRLEVREWSALPSRENLAAGRYTRLQDLAWAEIEDSELEKADLAGAAISDLAYGDPLDNDLLYAAVGFPWSLLRSRPEASTILDWLGRPFSTRFTDLTSYTMFTNPSGSGATENGEHIVTYENLVHSREAEVVESPPPNGMSGGGLWELRPLQFQDRREVKCRLVGLIRAQRGEQLLAIPIEHWIKALVSSEPELQDYLKSEGLLRETSKGLRLFSSPNQALHGSPHD